ncbi:MAG: hypothetical protein LBT40_00970 [Deltaproteobacteria bacterium]|jgi:hypothetical protein|nr:hypothetical protein [Deltaproteobacteria bacterium]
MKTYRGQPHWELSSLIPEGEEGFAREVRESLDMVRDFTESLAGLDDPEKGGEWFRDLTLRLRVLEGRRRRYESVEELGDMELPGFTVPWILLSKASAASQEFGKAVQLFMSRMQALPQERADALLEAVPEDAYCMRRAMVNLTDDTPGLDGLVPSSLSAELKKAQEAKRRGQRRKGLPTEFLEAVADWTRLGKPGERPGPHEHDDQLFEIPSEVVDTMLRVAREEGPKAFRKHFLWKAGLLGYKLLGLERFAAVPGKPVRVPSRMAFSLVLESFGEFAPILEEHVSRMVYEGRLSMVRLPESSSIVSCTIQSPEGEPPWVYVAPNDDLKSLIVLAQTLMRAAYLMHVGSTGGFHSTPPQLLYDAVQAFGGLLAYRSLLGKVRDATRRNSVICQFMYEVYLECCTDVTTVVAQDDAFRALGDRGESLGQVMKEVKLRFAEQFGDALSYQDSFSFETFVEKLFFRPPFLEYNYLFGKILAFGFWDIYEKEGSGFADRFLCILAAGGRAAPLDILAEAGVGPLDESFWRGCFRAIERFGDMR